LADNTALEARVNEAHGLIKATVTSGIHNVPAASQQGSSARLPYGIPPPVMIGYPFAPGFQGVPHGYQLDQTPKLPVPPLSHLSPPTALVPPYPQTAKHQPHLSPPTALVSPYPRTAKHQHQPTLFNSGAAAAGLFL
jgi:hypothetical protein